ncbi:LPXTG cell wall anchor domain-containing protein [Caloramator sp. mosi_1]|uniref:LPXTG cell wall anchor domain-containing protein n=1 Tax=Caloramator sp. mosi_1 TaxID=3023090 RepID=UPI002362417F|nr:LPXTG cell wall anchor domain-containing protein [Caloramator sp. mosi_1]WDC83580.1 LPXTG cell wall anchor domain-containing protein [Caloramator sp. mosi_1]
MPKQAVELFVKQYNNAKQIKDNSTNNNEERNNPDNTQKNKNTMSQNGKLPKTGSAFDFVIIMTGAVLIILLGSIMIVISERK